MKKKAYLALSEFFAEVGVPMGIHSNNEKELMLGRWREICEGHGMILMTTTEPHSPWQNKSERDIKELKRVVLRLMQWQRMPKWVWNFAAVYVTEI